MKKALILLVMLFVCIVANAQTNVVDVAITTGVGFDIPGLNLLPVKIQKWIFGLLVVVPLLGRMIHALKSGGGLVGIWNAIVFGTNTPAQKPTVTTTTPPQP